ncbi:MAG: type II toxin-antitoxin system HipA family toxin, partial [Flavobacteriales bacterium]
TRGTGALEYEPGKDVIGSISEVDFNELAEVSKKIIENKYEYSDFVKNQEALQHILTIGSSVGGAQAKVLVSVHNKTGELRAGDVLHQDAGFDYYIVKLAYDSETAWGAEKTSVEYAYHQMALECGIKMMPCELLETGDSLHFRTKRFDRVEGQKLHTQTLAALTSYSNRNVPFSYEQVFRIMERLQVSHRDKEQLFKQMVFNVASCNMDDHMKNFGFIMERSGEWKLSPAYDLTYPFDPYLPSMMFHKMSINGKTKNIKLNDVLAVGQLVGIRNAKGLVSQICAAVASFSTKAQQLKISKRTIKTVQAELEKRIALLQ